MKRVLFVLTLVITGCSKPTLEDRINDELAVVRERKFKDPKSYHFIENKLDSITYYEYLDEMSDKT